MIHTTRRCRAAACGRLEVTGRIVNASNATLFCDIEATACAPSVCTSRSRERPLWDFPTAPWPREYASYLLAEAFAGRLRHRAATVLREGPRSAWCSCGSTRTRTASWWTCGHPATCRTLLTCCGRGLLGEPAVLVHADHPELRGWPCWTSAEQRRPQGRPVLAARTGGSTAWTTHLPARGGQACAPCSGWVGRSCHRAASTVRAVRRELDNGLCGQLVTT